MDAITLPKPITLKQRARLVTGAKQACHQMAATDNNNMLAAAWEKAQYLSGNRKIHQQSNGIRNGRHQRPTGTSWV